MIEYDTQTCAAGERLYVSHTTHRHTHTLSLTHTLTHTHTQTDTRSHTLSHRDSHTYSDRHTHTLSLTHSVISLSFSLDEGGDGVIQTVLISALKKEILVN